MKNLIGGNWKEASDGKTFEVINPATGEAVDTVPVAGEAEVDEAVLKGREAQKIWALVPVHKKAEIMMKFLGLVEAEKEKLAKLLSDETGKPIKEARGEINNIFISFKAFSEKAKHLYDEVIPAGIEEGQDKNIVIVKREPKGLIACVIPFNFPCDLFDQKVAPALLAGNAVIVKPSSDNPLTLIRLCDLLDKAGVTKGAIQILTGPGSLTGRLLCGHKGIDAVTLTGSTAVGIETAKSAAEHLTPCALELGGNDAFIVLEDADLDLAVAETVWGRMYNTGQVCCASKRFLVHEAVLDEFTEKLIKRLSQLKQMQPSSESCELGCLISEKAAEKVEKQIKLTVEQGGKILLGGKRKGAFIEATVIGDVPASADVAKDMEIFGPVVPIIPIKNEEEGIAIANASMFGLCGCVFTKNMKTALRVCNALECGGTVINGASFFRSFEMPFGGYKYSGIGTEGVSSTFDEVTNKKSIVLKNILG